MSNATFQTQLANLQSIKEELKIGSKLPQKQMLHLIQAAYANLKNQPNVLSISSPLMIVGDIHGQFYDLLYLFQKYGNPPETNYLFLGDYVDRGMFSIEVISYLLAIKVKYPQAIYLLRGNHQTQRITSFFNFRQECLIKYNVNVYRNFIMLFNSLPICAVIDQKYFAVHAGISPSLQTISQIQKINRFREPTEKDPFNDLLWSDPSQKKTQNWQFNIARNCSFYYSPLLAKKFLDKNNLQLIIRAHEVEMQGFKYQKTPDKQQDITLTIFSAPNYCDTYHNMGAVVQLKDSRTFKIYNIKYTQHPIILPDYQNIFEWSLPIISKQILKIVATLIKKHPQKSANYNRARRSIRQSRISIQNALMLQRVISELEQQQAIKKQKKQKELKAIRARTSITLQEFNNIKRADLLQQYPKDQIVFGPKLDRTWMKMQNKVLEMPQQQLQTF